MSKHSPHNPRYAECLLFLLNTDPTTYKAATTVDDWMWYRYDVVGRVQSATILRRHRQRQRREIEHRGVSNAEEISERYLDAGMLLPVPVHPQHGLTEVERVFRPDGEPDMTDDARSF